MLDKDFRDAGFHAGDLAGQRLWRVHQVPVVLKLEDSFDLWNDLHFVQGHGALEILHV
jgi:hypothetical protein